MNKIKIPKELNELDDDSKIREYLLKAFCRILNECKKKSIKEFEVVVDYGGEVTLTNGNKVPCEITWNLKKMKEWVKQQPGYELLLDTTKKRKK